MATRNVLIALATLAGISLCKSLPPQTQQQPSTPVIAAAPSEKTLAEQGAEALALEQYAEAISLLYRAAEQDPGNAQLWVDMGYAYLALGNCDCAIVKLTYALQLDPSHAQAYWLRAQAYEMRGAEGDQELAWADARQAAQLAPSNLQTHELLASIENAYVAALPPTPVQSRLDRPRRTGSQTSELQRLSQQIDREPGSPFGYLWRALYLWNQSGESGFVPAAVDPSATTEMLGSALRDLNIAIALDPQFAPAYELRSYIYLQTQELGLALADLQMLQSLGFENSALHQQRARVLYEMGSSYWVESLDHVNRALQVAATPEDMAGAYEVRGMIFEGFGLWDPAFADYTQALGIRPMPGVYYRRGLLTLQAGLNPAGALADLERALSLWQSSGGGSWLDVQDAQQVRAALLGSF